MTRPLRLSFENAFYHITARGNRREDIFYSSRDKEIFLKRLKEMLKRKERGQVSTFDITLSKC